MDDVNRTRRYSVFLCLLIFRKQTLELTLSFSGSNLSFPCNSRWAHPVNTPPICFSITHLISHCHVQSHLCYLTWSAVILPQKSRVGQNCFYPHGANDETQSGSFFTQTEFCWFPNSTWSTSWCPKWDFSHRMVKVLKYLYCISPQTVGATLFHMTMLCKWIGSIVHHPQQQCIYFHLTADYHVLSPVYHYF